jgi:hypothetical protein
MSRVTATLASGFRAIGILSGMPIVPQHHEDISCHYPKERLMGIEPGDDYVANWYRAARDHGVSAADALYPGVTVGMMLAYVNAA